MKKLVLILVAAAVSGALQGTDNDMARWERQAQNVTIDRIRGALGQLPMQHDRDVDTDDELPQDVNAVDS